MHISVCAMNVMHSMHHIHSTECVVTTVLLTSVHMTSIASVHPGRRSSSVALLKVSSLPFKSFLGGSSSSNDVRVPGPRMSYVDLVKVSTFVRFLQCAPK